MGFSLAAAQIICPAAGIYMCLAPPHVSSGLLLCLIHQEINSVTATAGHGIDLMHMHAARNTLDVSGAPCEEGNCSGVVHLPNL